MLLLHPLLLLTSSAAAAGFLSRRRMSEKGAISLKNAPGHYARGSYLQAGKKSHEIRLSGSVIIPRRLSLLKRAGPCGSSSTSLGGNGIFGQLQKFASQYESLKLRMHIRKDVKTSSTEKPRLPHPMSRATTKPNDSKQRGGITLSAGGQRTGKLFSRLIL